jgi:DNA-binding PadR family transcriptional regulator
MIRGHLRFLALNALAKKDMSGYELMKFFEQAIGKKPSPGSIYPCWITCSAKA